MRRLLAARAAERGEEGIVMVLTALTLTVLMTFAAFGIDVANWYFVANRVQNAADAAALAGVVYIRQGVTPTGPATTTARTVAGGNGYVHGADGGRTQVIVVATPNPAQLKVTVVTEVRNYFGNVAGVDRTIIRRSGVAEFEGPLPMGSPENTLGDEPVGSGQVRWGSGDSVGHWLNIAGPTSTKQSGDRHQSSDCGGGPTFCTGAAVAVHGRQNDDYSPDGYFFSVRVSENDAFRPLAIQVFDPVFVEVGDTCTENGGQSEWLATAAADAAITDVPDRPARYARGTTEWCTGDHGFAGGSSAVPTTFLVRRPDQTPWSSVDNGVITGCTPTYASVPQGAQLATIKGNAAVRSQFRQWVTLCTIPSAAPGDYIVQVRTNAVSGSPATYDRNSTGAGHNRFSLRAALMAGTTPQGDDVEIFAQSRLPIYGNDETPQASPTRVVTEFYLARVPSTARGRTLQLFFFDTGDANFRNGGTASMVVLPPEESSLHPDNGGVGFRDCPLKYYKPSVTTSTLSNCTVTGISEGDARFQGGLMNVSVPIPATYNCGTSGDDCWLKVRFDYPPGTAANDTTTWTAVLEGDPVRLVE